MFVSNKITFSHIFASFFIVAVLSSTINCEDIKRHFSHIQSKLSNYIQQKEAQNVIRRIIPHLFKRFIVQVDFSLAENSFQIYKDDNTSFVTIRGSSGVSACKGFYYYFKYYLKGHISWSGYQLPNNSVEFPSVQLQLLSPNRFIYYQNVCTWSYSFAWWTWSKWRSHIDWMAFMGINLSLAPIQEAIWTNVYRKIGLSEEEIDQHFSGPAFQAWQRMGNIRGWGGKLSERYRLEQLKLQKKIIKAQRSLGIVIAVPSFAGHVPLAFKTKFPNNNFTSSARWNHFQNKFCCPLFIDPSDSFFANINGIFLKEVIREYGTDHIYFADPFNELIPKKSSVEYLNSVSLGIYNSMQNVDPKAIWLLQGWMFVQNPFWSKELIESFLKAVPIGKLIILDLMSEQFPQYIRTDSYFGHTFIWNMLHNFGGTLGMHGSVYKVNKAIQEAQNMYGSTMIGGGITPEGINQNYPLYEFVLERMWSHDRFNETKWFEYYTIVRYGTNNENLKETWRYLLNSVYNYNGLIKLHGKYIISRRPSLKISTSKWYNPSIVKVALKSMLKSSKIILQNKLLEHDLVDLTRQFLQLVADIVYTNIISTYKKSNIISLKFWSHLMITLLHDLEKILRSNRNFLLGLWLKDANNLGEDWYEKSLFELNARNQITLWGPNGEIVDYANKQWSGVVEDFFIPRWKLFLNEIINSLLKNTTYNEDSFKIKLFKNVESRFVNARKMYPTKSLGNCTTIALNIYSKWKNVIVSKIN